MSLAANVKSLFFSAGQGRALACGLTMDEFAIWGLDSRLFGQPPEHWHEQSIEHCSASGFTFRLPAVGTPQALVLAADVCLAGVETFRVAFLSLHGPDQFGFVHLPALDVAALGQGFDFVHIHRRYLSLILQFGEQVKWPVFSEFHGEISIDHTSYLGRAKGLSVLSAAWPNTTENLCYA
ncbi:MAG: hypothetical protein ACSLFH_06110 [Desulfuromonadales bacterium]